MRVFWQFTPLKKIDFLGILGFQMVKIDLKKPKNVPKHEQVKNF